MSLFLLGEMRSNHRSVVGIWADDGCGIDYIRSTMSYERFLFLSRCVRADDAETRALRREMNKLAPIRVFFDKFITNCKSNFVPGECVTH